MPTKRTPRRFGIKNHVRITDDTINLYRAVVDMFCEIDRDALISNDGFLDATARLDAAFPHISTMIVSTFGHDVPPDYENHTADWLAAHAIRMQLDKAANIEWT